MNSLGKPTARDGIDRRLVLIAVGVVTLACLARAMQLAWLSDDGFISFRYAQNLAEGRGLVYNAGEYVEGYTNLLWTLALAGFMRWGA
jgi:arabinofuranosyltransferase